MKNIFSLICFLFLLTSLAFAQNDRQVADVFKEKLAEMSDSGKAQNAQQDWQKFCFQLGAPGQEARKTEAVQLMTESLDKADPKTQAWLIRQLGRLGDGTCVAAISKFLDADDQLLRDQTVWALANIPNNDAGEILRTKLAKETDAAKKTALENALKYRAGRKEQDAPHLSVIFEILEKVQGKYFWDKYLPELAWLHDVKISSLPNYKERFTKLDPLAKILLIDALAAVRDRSALLLAVEMLDSEDNAQKLAGYRALGQIGDASALPLLVDKIRAEGDLGNTVRDSLVRLNYDGADAAIIAQYEKQPDNSVKNELIDVLRKRQGTIAIPVFESALSSTDNDIRQRSVYALESIGEPSSIPALVDRYFKEEKRDVRDAIDRAVVRIGSRYEDMDGRGEVICTEISKRNENEKIELLPILGKVGGSAARKLIMEFLTTGSDVLKDAAFKSLCNWPDASVADELYKIASAKNDARAAAATKAYLRVITLRTERSAKESLTLFQKGMDTAKSAEDKRFLLTRIETARSMEVFRFAAAFLDNAELNQEACRAVVDMANDHGFYMNNRKEIDPALDKVIALSKDKNHVDRAKRYKERQ